MDMTAIEARAAACFAAEAADDAFPVVLTDGGEALTRALATTPDAVRAPAARWAAATGFAGAAGETALAPGADGEPAAMLVGLGGKPAVERVGALPKLGALKRLGRPIALYAEALDAEAAAVEWALGAYRFSAMKSGADSDESDGVATLATAAAARETAERTARAVYLARDLVNTPASHLGPEALGAAVMAVAARHGADAGAIVGEDLLAQNYPMIHAVGRAGGDAPRLLDMTWGDPDAPKVTLVGKGVCFDTGGLDLKPPRFMRNMKKDMGGAAAALALAELIMAAKLPVRLRVLIPAVENGVGPGAFRPGDVLTSRKGLTVEIGDTDAEGRLVLADALAEADGESPELLLDFATLTGAARVALGPEIAPFYTDDSALAAALETAGAAARDPLWRMPLHAGYKKDLSSSVADMVNTGASGFAGSITAALFLQRYVSNAAAWAHFDIFAWNAKARPGRPEGGEATAARAVFLVLAERYAGDG